MAIENVKHINQIDDKKDNNLNFMRTEVQKIINNHLKEDDDKRFSVMDRNYDKLNLLINLLSGEKSRLDLEKELKQNEKELQMTYEQIVCEYDFMSALKNLAKETKLELTSLNSDIALESNLNNLGY